MPWCGGDEAVDTLASSPVPGLGIVDAGGADNAFDEDKNDVLEITSVTATTSDPDGPATSLDGVTSVTGTYGTLFIQADGAYTYALFQPGEAGYDTLNALGQNETVAETFGFSVSDGNGGTDTAEIKFTVVGSNDEPEITATTGATVTEDADPDTLTGTGTITVSDVDANDTHTFSSEPVGDAIGSLVLATDDDGNVVFDAAGNATYTYTVDNTLDAVQSLGEGVELEVSFEVTITDAFGEAACETVTVTIVGTNDQPQLGDICVGDPDNVDASGGTGSDMSGNVYEDCGLLGQLPNIVKGDALRTGPDDADDTPAEPGLAVDAANDVFASDIDEGDVLSVVEIQAKSDGSLTGSPATVSTSMAGTVMGTYGSIAIGANGAYVYTLYDTASTDGAALNALQQDEVVSEEFQLTISDDSGADNATNTACIKFTVVGTNDLPTIDKLDGLVTQIGDADDASILTATGTSAIVDADDGDEHSVVENSLTSDAGNLGTVTNVSIVDGELVYDYQVTDGAIQYLGAGESETDTFTVTVSDGTETVDVEICVKIDGANDTPTADKITFVGTEADLAGASMVNLLDASNAADVDQNDTVTVDPASLEGTLGLALATETGHDLQIDLPIEALLEAGLVSLDAAGNLAVPPALASALSELMEAGDNLSIDGAFDVTDGTATAEVDICVDIAGESAAPEMQPDYGCADGQVTPDFLVPSEADTIIQSPEG